MGSTVYQRGPVAPQMNITPLIDVVFLLIVFFMLVNNLVAQRAVEMRLPELDDAQTRQVAEAGQLVVNVVPEDGARRGADPLAGAGVPSRVQVGPLQTFEVTDLAGVREALAGALEREPELEVLLRADAGLRYEHVQPVLDAIRGAGVERVSLVAYLPEQGAVE